jgi:hypothetical protein
MFPSLFLSRARRRASCAFVLAAGLAAPAAAEPDIMAQWHRRAMIASAAAHLDLVTESVMLAVLHLAMLHAIHAADEAGAPTPEDGCDALGAHADAAAVSAAHVVLSSWLPAERARLDAALMHDLAATPEGASRDLGVAAGRQAAELVMARWARARPEPGAKSAIP